MNKPSSGFTLIEILIVLVLISLMSGFLIINLIPDQQEKLQNESDRLSQVLTQAADIARLSGKKITWSTNGKQYFFKAQEIIDDKSAQFKPLTSKRYADDTFKDYQLPNEIVISKIYLNNQEHKINIDNPIYLSPAGINTPFSIVLSISGNTTPSIELEGLPIGKVVNKYPKNPTTNQQN